MAYLKPGAVFAKVVNPVVRMLGVTDTLAVRKRRSGEWQTIPVNVLELDGTRYLVAVRGETEWVRNLRAAGGGELRRRGRHKPFTASELPVAERPRIIGAYRERWDSQVKRLFAELPDPGDHPVFRLATNEPGGSEQPGGPGEAGGER